MVARRVFDRERVELKFIVQELNVGGLGVLQVKPYKGIFLLQQAADLARIDGGFACRRANKPLCGVTLSVLARRAFAQPAEQVWVACVCLPLVRAGPRDYGGHYTLVMACAQAFFTKDCHL